MKKLIKEIKGFINFISDLIDDFIDLIYWIINKKEIQKQIEEDDKQYNNTLITLRKANRKVIELETEINILLSEMEG